MSPSVLLINIIGGVCLLLWGLRNVRNGITRALGNELHVLVSKSTGNRVTAFLSGIGVTALVQSSTATALIIAAFCGQGILSVSGGLAVMLGADVGTTLVAQFLSYDLSWFAPALIALGYFLYANFKDTKKWRHIGRFFIGLGLMLIALMLIRTAAEPLKGSQTLEIVLSSLGKDPIFAVLIAAIITWILHSSLAMVLLLMSFVVTGILPVGTGIAMVLGANLGGALTPFIVTLKDSRMAARVPFGNIVVRGTGVIICLPFVDQIVEQMTAFGIPPERLLVDFHFAFNLALAVLFLPLVKPLAKLCENVLVVQHDPQDEKVPRYLDEKELATTSVALSSAVRETLRMADVLENMLDDTLGSIRNNDASMIYNIRKRDDIIDSLYRSLKLYMAKITSESLDSDESYRYVQILSYAGNIEASGDTIDKSLMEMAHKKIKDKLRFSESGWKDIEKVHYFVLENMRLAQSVFVSEDVDLARKLVEGKETLRLMEKKAVEAHFQRIREGIPETIATSALHLDILRDYRRINSFMAALGYAILEEHGQLRSSRLRNKKTKKNN